METSNQPLATNRSKILAKYGICLLLEILGVIAFFIWRDQSRTTYSFSNGTQVTVWKRLGGTCYVIPGSYSGFTKPKPPYIETSNAQYLTLYLADRFPKTLITRPQGTASGIEGAFKIVDGGSGDWEIILYDESWREKLYDPGATRLNDVAADVDFLDIDIHDGTAIGKHGYPE